MQLGASKIVIVCITSHHLLPHLPPYLRDKILCLVGLIIEEVARRKNVICYYDQRRAPGAVFKSHRNWHQWKSRSCFPTTKISALSTVSST